MRKRLMIAAAVTGMTVSFLLAQSTRSAEVQFKAAQHKQQVEGDLKGAIEQYKKIAQGSDRTLAAKALVAVGECYELLGSSEARAAYERVVRDYADQKETVALARGHLGGTQPTRQSNTLVLSRPQLGARGRVSPDGRYLSYTDWGSQDLAVHEITTGIDRRLTGNYKQKPPDHGFSEGSVISRDGKQIIYLWFSGTDDNNEKAELRLASLAGDPNPRRLYENPEVDWLRPWDWSPDGKWVSVEVFRKDGTREIGLISVPDGSLRMLKSVDWRDANGIFFSPDGKYLGFDAPQNETGSERDVFVLSVDGAREIRAVAHPSNDRMMGWSPDGRWLLFASDRNGSVDLWGLPMAEGKAEGAPTLLRANIPFAPQIEPMGITRSGALYYAIYGSQIRSEVQVASVDLAAGKYLSGPTNITQDYLESDVRPGWSADGQYLAYLSFRRGVGPINPVLVIRSAETSQVVRELRVKLNDTYWGPVWAPDGRSFLFQGRDFQGRWGIYLMDAQKGDVSLLLPDPRREILYPQWSRDGKNIYFSRRISGGGGGFALVQRDLTSGNEKELLRRAVVVGDAPSPDGRYLAPSSVDPSSGSRVKLLLPTTGGEPRELMRVAAGVEPGDLTNYGKGVTLVGAQWAPDSRSFFTSKHLNDGKHTVEVWRVSLDGSAPLKVDRVEIPWGPLSPDGRRIAFTTDEDSPRRDTEIWALESFLPAASK